MIDIYTFLSKTFITLLVVTDPFLVVPVFAGLSVGQPKQWQIYTAKKSCLIALMLLIFFALGGEFLLDIMGISNNAFSIAGGFLLLLAGIEMVRAETTGLTSATHDEEEEASDKKDISVFPLAIPLIAGPGAMTSMLVLMNSAESIGFDAEIAVIVLTVVVIGIMYISMRFANVLMKFFGLTGMNVLTRVFGVILSALAVQNIIQGVIGVYKNMI